MNIRIIKNKIIVFLIILIIVINLTGCWDAQPLESTFVVTGIGIDISEDNSDLLSVTVFGPTFIEENTNKPYVAFTSEAASIGIGLENIKNKTYRQMSISHTLVLLFSEEIAKYGISKYLDLFIRNPEIGSHLTVAIVKGRASDVLQSEAYSNPNTAFFIQQQIETESRRINLNEFSLRGVINNINEQYTSLVLPLISMNQDKKQITINEIAVFENDKMVGTFDSLEMTSLLILRGSLERGVLEIGKINPKGADNTVILFRIYPKKRKINLTVDNEGNVDVDMYFSIDSDLYELEPLQKSLNEKVIEYIVTEGEKTLEKNMLEVIKKLQEDYKIDAIGLSEYVRVKYPEYYREIDWKNIFPDVNISVEVDMTLKGIGLNK